MKKAGIYSLNLWVKKPKDNYDTKHNMLFDRVIVNAGPYQFNKTQVELYNYTGSWQSVSFEVDQVISFKITFNDKFDNPTTLKHLLKKDYPTILPDLYELDYKIISVDYIILDFDSFYLLKMKVFKTGLLENMQLKLYNQSIYFEDLQKNILPDNIIIKPGKVSNIYPQVEMANEVLVGVNNSIIIQTRDQYNNTIKEEQQETIFKCSITQGQLDNVAINIKYIGHGQYMINYVIGWQGIYQVMIELGGEDFAEQQQMVYFAKCPRELPALCSNSQECKASYSECNLPSMNATMCGQGVEMFACKVKGVLTCVKQDSQCDCPYNQTRCSHNNNICMEQGQCQQLQQNRVCSNYKCDDGSCRIDRKNCASVSVCPPGYQMCMNQQCQPSHLPCLDTFLQTRTRVTCSNQNYVVCPDNTCQPSQWHCQAPPLQCQPPLVRCADYSCRPNSTNCPTFTVCPQEQALCENQICSPDCSNIKNKTNVFNNPFVVNERIKKIQKRIENKQRKLQQNISDIALKYKLSQQVSRLNTRVITLQNIKLKKVCFNGQLVDDEYHCGTGITCLDSRVRCADFQCRESLLKCVQKTCGENRFKCEDGRCVKNNTLCGTMTSCPDDYPVKCEDGGCVKQGGECDARLTTITDCPNYAPYSCSNGECRASASECSTTTWCPPEKPILCSDHQCVRSKFYCSPIVKAQQLQSNTSVLCPDGLQADSFMMCNSQMTCAPGLIKCWDQSCVKSQGDCPPVSLLSPTHCPASRPFQCPDGSCSDFSVNCPTQVFCPEEFKIRCSDGNCRSSIKECAVNTNCAPELTLCPSGACIKGELSDCGTQITCSQQAPYMCWDYTCVTDQYDCPSLQMVQCNNPLNPIRCPDSTCVSKRELCKEIIDRPCPSNKLVRCPDLSCVKHVRDCVPLQNTCPVGFVVCPDNTCRPHQRFCKPDLCPMVIPHKCFNGQCVSDPKFCDHDNNCPFHLPVRCKESKQCVKEQSDCVGLVVSKCGAGKVLCPDNSCRSHYSYCPTTSGCPVETPIKCITGKCVAKGTTCPTARCSIQNPVQCPDGSCVTSYISCSLDELETNNRFCSNVTGANTYCAGGRCVPFQAACPPIDVCPIGYFRCQDGSCRILQRYCPLAITLCPASLPYMCQEGICAKNKNSCRLNNGCNPIQPYKCNSNGLCVAKSSDCQDIDSNPVARTKNQKVLITRFTLQYSYHWWNVWGDNLDAQMMADIQQMQILTNQMTTQTRAIAATNNTQSIAIQQQLYNSTQQQLQSVTNNYLNSTRQLVIQPQPMTGNNMQNSNCKHICPDSTCAENFNQCLTTEGCPINKPFVCSRNAVTNQVTCGSSLYLDDPTGCKQIVQCPAYKPIKCDDGSCVPSYRMCHTCQKCPSSAPFRCPLSKNCVAKESMCNTAKCPSTMPIICQEDGRCVKSQLDCIYRETILCPTQQPYKCSTGICVAVRNLCSLQSQNIHSTINNTNTSSKQSNSTFRHLQQQPAGYNCKYQCADGSCRQSQNNCLLPDGCTYPKQPYLCQNGDCVSSNNQCNNKQKVICAPGLMNCADGYCRRECPPYNGCPLDKPLHCLSGRCVQHWTECAGYEMCTLDKPYRGYNGQCLADPLQATRYTRQIKFNKITVEVLPQKSLTVPFLYRQGSIKNEAQLTLNHPNITANASQYYLFISHVPDQLIYNYSVPFQNKQYKDVVKQFPSVHNQMHSSQAVRSSPIEINYTMTESSKKVQMFLSLTYDQLHNTSASDYCLGQMMPSTQTIECIAYNQPQSLQSPNTLTFSFHQPGQYMVIYYPNSTNDYEKYFCDYFCKHRNQLLWYTLVIMLVAMSIAYFCYKLFNLFTKLKQAKKREEKYKNNLDYVLSLQGSKVNGEGVRDMQLGILFKKNMAYQAASAEMTSIAKKIKEMSEECQMLEEKEIMYQNDNNELRQINQNLLDLQAQAQSQELNDEFNEDKLLLDDKFTS